MLRLYSIQRGTLTQSGAHDSSHQIRTLVSSRSGIRCSETQFSIHEGISRHMQQKADAGMYPLEASYHSAAAEPADGTKSRSLRVCHMQRRQISSRPATRWHATQVSSSKGTLQQYGKQVNHDCRKLHTKQQQRRHSKKQTSTSKSTARRWYLHDVRLQLGV